MSGARFFFCIKLLLLFFLPQVGSVHLLNLVDAVMLVISWKMLSPLLSFDRQNEHGHYCSHGCLTPNCLAQAFMHQSMTGIAAPGEEGTKIFLHTHVRWTPLQEISIKSPLRDLCNFTMSHMHAAPAIVLHRDSQAIWMPRRKLLALQAPFTCCFEVVHVALVTVIKMCNPQLKCASQLQIYREGKNYNVKYCRPPSLLQTAKTSHWTEILIKYPAI